MEEESRDIQKITEQRKDCSKTKRPSKSDRDSQIEIRDRDAQSHLATERNI
jgi:hypothetical protein